MKLLMIVDKFYPKPYANTICADKIADYLKSQGIDIDFLAFKDSGIIGENTHNDSNVYYVNPDLRLKLFYYADNFNNKKISKIAKFLAKILSFSRKIFTFNFEPFYSFSFPKRISKSIIKLDKKNSYDGIITLLQPFDGTYAVFKKYKKIKKPWIIYAVDNLNNFNLKKYFKTRDTNKYWSLKFLKKCSGFIFTKSRENLYSDPCFDKFKKKMYASDIPLLNENLATPSYKYFKRNMINICYFGSLNSIHYNPIAVLEAFEKMKIKNDCALHFFSRGNGTDCVSKYSREHKLNVFIHDYLPYSEMLSVEKAADVLLSMKFSTNISAKIFEYISTGKPIIHFSGIKNDPDVPYLVKYGNAKIFNLFDDVSTDFDFESFIKINYSKISNDFCMNKPKFSGDLIRGIITNDLEQTK